MFLAFNLRRLTLLSIALSAFPLLAEQKPSIAVIHEAPMLPSNDDSSVVIKEKFTLLVDGKPVGFINWNGYTSDSTTAGLYSFYIEKEHRAHVWLHFVAKYSELFGTP